MINYFVVIVNFRNRFDKGLTKIFLFRRALPVINKSTVRDLCIYDVMPLG